MTRSCEADSWCQGVHTVAPRATTTATRPASHRRAATFSEYGSHAMIYATDSQDFKIQNVGASCDVKLPIRLEGLAYSHGAFSSDKVMPTKDQENSKDAKRQPIGVKHVNNNRAYEGKESSSTVFLKTCTFLVE